MTRGFVTIATGTERYFDIARNLLWSYRQFASEKYPFAIICDRENEYTAEFDDVILLKEAHCNYLDKLQLYDYLPYDETIFIDADSLAYGNLDEWWDIFKDAADFSLFGYAWMDLKSGRGWFVPDGTGEFKDKITFIPDFNGGIYYMRRSERCRKVFDLANYFAENFSQYSFNGFTTPADEPCLALAMAVEQCMPLDIKEKGLVFAPRKEEMELDITVPKARYFSKTQGIYCVNLVHWSNFRTKLSWYKSEVYRLSLLQRNKKSGILFYFFIVTRIGDFALCAGNVLPYMNRVINKLKRILR